MRMRKTLEIETLREQVNAYLANESPYVTADMRLGAAMVLETALHATGNYGGYNFLGWLNGGCDAWMTAGEPADRAPFIGDESRRVYYARAKRTRHTARRSVRAAEPASLNYPKGL